MRTERTSLTTINKLLDMLTQHTAFEPFSIEVHIGPGLMFYLLPELMDQFTNLSRHKDLPGQKVDVTFFQHFFVYCGHKFIVSPELANGFSIHVNGGLVTRYAT